MERPLNRLLFPLVRLFGALFPLLFAAGCMDYGPLPPVDFDHPEEHGLFIACEGNFMYGNASLSYYDPATRQVENSVFSHANGIRLGDVAHSMTLYDGLCWIVVNNSGVIFAIDPTTFREQRRLTGFTSPRYIHFLSADKAYVTQLWDPRIYIVDPQRGVTTGYIETGMDFKTGSTEQMIQYGRYLYVNCWSYQNCLLVIDTATDLVCDRLTLGIQPSSMALDCHGKLWVITDGGYAGSPYGHERPALYRIDAATRTVEHRFLFDEGSTPSNLALDGTGRQLYFIDSDVWRMDVTADRLPLRPLIRHRETIFYALTIDPATGEIYVADAIDYEQPGVILRHTPEGELLDEFKVGIIPGSFCWK